MIMVLDNIALPCQPYKLLSSSVVLAPVPLLRSSMAPARQRVTEMMTA
jgi:hypothetical protein